MTWSDWASLGAVVSAVVALTFSVVNLVLERRDRQDDQRRDNRIEAIQRQQSEAIGRMAALAEEWIKRGSSAGGATTQAGPQPPAQIGVRLVKKDHGERLVIKNSGAGPARVLDLQVLGQPDVIVGPTGLGMVDLLPGEDYPVTTAITFGTELPLNVLVRWIDSEGPKVREQQVPFG